MELKVFTDFMKMFGMREYLKVKLPNNNTVIKYTDEDTSESDNTVVSSVGYDNFNAGILYNEDGKVLLCYLDSHVAYSSKHSEEIDSILEKAGINPYPY